MSAVLARPMTVEEGARELVDRARLGDQNATAMLVRVRANAMKGVKRAQQAYTAALAHAKGQAPARSPSKVGADPLKQIKRAAPQVKTPSQYLMLVGALPFCPEAPGAEILSRGPVLGKDVLTFIGSTFGSDGEKRAYEYGVMSTTEGFRRAFAGAKPPFRRALQTGRVVGLASRVQAARAGNIAAISKKAAWELT